MVRVVGVVYVLYLVCKFYEMESANGEAGQEDYLQEQGHQSQEYGSADAYGGYTHLFIMLCRSYVHTAKPPHCGWWNLLSWIEWVVEDLYVLNFYVFTSYTII